MSAALPFPFHHWREAGSKPPRHQGRRDQSKLNSVPRFEASLKIIQPKTQTRYAENAAAAQIGFRRLPHRVMSENGDENDESEWAKSQIRRLVCGDVGGMSSQC
jgi:hypothetical protein